MPKVAASHREQVEADPGAVRAVGVEGPLGRQPPSLVTPSLVTPSPRSSNVMPNPILPIVQIA